jgi:hypothetical protein
MYIEIDFSLLSVRKGPITLPEGTSIQDAIDTAVYYNMPFFIICYDSHEDIRNAVIDYKGCVLMKPLNDSKDGPDKSWPEIMIDPPFLGNDNSHQEQSHQPQVLCP